MTKINLEHIAGLNGLRAIAVMLVIVSHRFPQDHIAMTFPIGNFGVDIFFVLSGYLISRILFQQLIIINSTGESKWVVIKNFILRRALRIFPIYYLTLIFLYLTKGIIGNFFEEHVWWYVFYISNYLNFIENRWFGALAHLWSLSVEEQFYIVWPFMIFYFFRKRLLVLLGIMIVFGTIYPFFFTGITKVLTLGCISSFGIGALLAYVEVIQPNYKELFIKILKFIFWPVVIIIIIEYTVCKIPYFSDRLAISIVAVSAIAFCKYHSSSYLVQKILENKVMHFLGMISYGIYLYHNIVPRYWRFGLMQMGIDAPSVHYKFSYIEFVLQTLCIILISYFSWIWIEKPVLKLKKYLNYTKIQDKVMVPVDLRK